jgi:inosine/xanthosine triphosphate pyrophosphatase family protein
MSKELRFITKDEHKVREFQSLFANTQYMIVPAAGHSGEQRLDTRSLQAYLGHRNIRHTVRYSELSPTRFKDFWRV